MIAALSLLLATTANDVLASTDRELTKARDQVLNFEMITEDPTEGDRRLSFDVYLKGDSRRRIDFTAPGDIKGMRILMLSASQMYIWLPAFQKVRRLTSHVKEQGFMGTAFSQDEMSLVTYGPTYSPAIAKDSDTAWSLELTRKPNVEAAYAQLVLAISKELQQPVEIKYFSDGGVHVKTETREQFRCKEGICTPQVIRMIDHTRGDLTSRLEQRAWHANVGLTDEFFTVRELQRGLSANVRSGP